MENNKGNMYEGFKTWNPLSGQCPHLCKYCSSNNLKKRFPAINAKYSGELRLDDKAMKQSLGKGNTWFIVGQNDLFADEVPYEIIKSIIGKCTEYPNNNYFFQSKNPSRMYYCRDILAPLRPVLCTTIETNRIYPEFMGKTVSPYYRAQYMRKLSYSFVTALTIEPIMDFDIDELLALIQTAKPDYINIGADSKKNGLPEPSKDKILDLMESINLVTGIEIRKKTNLKRLLA